MSRKRRAWASMPLSVASRSMLEAPKKPAMPVVWARTALTLDESAARVQAMHDAARAVRKDIIVLCHGGPISEPDDAAYVLERTQGVVGFFGASSMERLPTEIALTETTRRFTQIKR